MALTFSNTLSVREFAQANAVKSLVGNVWPDSGKHFIQSDNGITLKVNEEAYQKFITKDIDGLAISECSEGDKNFFMLHMRKDGYQAEFTLTF